MGGVEQTGFLLLETWGDYINLYLYISAWLLFVYLAWFGSNVNSPTALRFHMWLKTKLTNITTPITLWVRNCRFFKMTKVALTSNRLIYAVKLIKNTIKSWRNK